MCIISTNYLYIYIYDSIPFVLKNFGEWEEVEVQNLLQYLEEGDAVIEVGAHIGSYTA